MRRMRRAGWLVAGIMEVPGKIWRLCFGTKERAIWSIIIFAAGSGVSSCSAWQYKIAKNATAEEILEYTKGNWCVSELLPRRVANDFKIKNNGGVLTFGDLKDAKRDCIEAEEKAAEAWRQSEAIKKAKAAAGIK